MSPSWDGSRAMFSWLARERWGEIEHWVHTQRVSCYIGDTCGRGDNTNQSKSSLHRVSGGGFR